MTAPTVRTPSGERLAACHPIGWKPETPCIETTWTLRHGYGRAMRGGVTWTSHRHAWTQANGAIPDGLWVLHHCDNRACINVEHLFLGTARDNIADMVAKGRHASGDRNGSRLRPDRRPRGPALGKTLPPRGGERNGRAKLSVDAVRAIRAAAGGVTQRELAVRHRVHVSTVQRIICGDRWGSVA